MSSLGPVASAAGISLRDILLGLDLAPELLDGTPATGIGLADYFRILERVSLALHDEGCGLTARPLMVGATDLVLFLHALLTLVTGEALGNSLRQVHTRSARKGARGFSAFWGVSIRWSSRFYALDYQAAAAGLTVSGCHPPPSSRAIYRRMVELAEDELRTGAAARSAFNVVCDAFSENLYSESAVARRAGVSIATLRRRLQAEGLPAFRELRDRALDRAARILLERHTSPGVVAEQLGFSDLRSFSRAFKRWTGLTPAAFARQVYRNPG